MERSTSDILLDMIDRPAFCVRNKFIIQVNQAARQRCITTEDNIADLLTDSYPAYAAFEGGCLFLTVTLALVRWGACVTRTEHGDIFLLDEQEDNVLQAMALSAQQLRTPLQNALTLSELIQRETRRSDNARQLEKSLYQLHRIICNMADANRYFICEEPNEEPTVLNSLFQEVMEKSQTMLEEAGIHLVYSDWNPTVIGLVDREMLERAIYNLVSNAAKFSSKGSTIEATLTHSGRMLSFSLQDCGNGFSKEALTTAFSRYRREPGIEDGRQGIGLGLSLVRSVASLHGGTVLIDQPNGKGARVTLTITVRNHEGHVLRSPVQLPRSDYAGGFDHALVELSEVLPPKAYKKND